MIGVTVLLVAAHLGTVKAFTFQTTAPKQCDSWTIQWDGGSPPFRLVLVPTETVTGGRIMNISMPAKGSPPYSHTFKLEQPATLDFVATMYDAHGWGSGGASDILTVASSSDATCFNSSVQADFYFWVAPTSNPSQCGNLNVQWNENARNPVGLYGIVPGGTAWEIPVPSMSARTLNWPVDIAAGNQFLLLMSDDGPIGTGGSTPLLTVAGSSNTTCLNSNSPHSTAVPPLLTASTVSGSSSSARTSSTSSRSSSRTSSSSNSASSRVSSSAAVAVPAAKSNIGTIVGAAIGAVVAVLLALILFFCLLRRRRHAKSADKAEPTSQRSIAPLSKEPLNDDSGTSRQSLFRRMTTVGRSPSGHRRLSSLGTLRATQDGVRNSRDLTVMAGLPHGAPAPSVFTDDSRSEHFELNPYPYESPPPDFATSAGHTLMASNMASSEKTPPTTATPIEPTGQNPFADPPLTAPTPRTPELNALSLRSHSATAQGEKSGSRYSSPVVRPRTRPSQIDLLTLNEHPDSTQNEPPPPPSSQSSESASDPPPQYNYFDRLRATNPDPDGSSPKM